MHSLRFFEEHTDKHLFFYLYRTFKIISNITNPHWTEEN